MKRVLLIALALLLVLNAGLCEAGMANPWTQTTAQGMMDALGLQMGLPDGATNVTWQMLEAKQMGEVRFTWQGVNYTARIAPTDTFEDISGMYYDWEQQQPCTVGRCNGMCYRAHDADDTVDLCLWYDEPTGLMYSVSVVEPDLDGFDILAAAEILFIPMQTE